MIPFVTDNIRWFINYYVSDTYNRTTYKGISRFYTTIVQRYLRCVNFILNFSIFIYEYYIYITFYFDIFIRKLNKNIYEIT